MLRRIVIAAMLGGGILVATASPAAATLSTPGCLARKLREWGRLRDCQAKENAKLLQARPAALAKCQARFDVRLAVLTTEAAAAGIACRYRVNGDGTVTDFDTGLQWEQKTADGSVHDRAIEHDWSPSLGRPDGTAFTVFLGTLNGGTSLDGETIRGCFAGHCDWRLPSIVELQSILDPTAPGCGRGAPCIDETVFGPTLAFFYWSATTDEDLAVFAWGVTFGGGGGFFPAVKDAPLFVRAVRVGL